MAIEAVSSLMAWPVTRSETVELVAREKGTNGDKLVFRRVTPTCFVLVSSWLDVGEARVETVLDGMHYLCYYDHSPATTRQAALLINRFLAEIEGE